MVARTLAVLLTLAGAGMAQRGTADLKGSVGYLGFFDDSTDNHGLFGASARFYITRGLAIEPEFLYLKGRSGHYDLTITPMVVYEWGRGRVRPYVTGGVGLLRSNYAGYSGNDEFFTGGLGAKIYVRDRWFVTPDWRFGVSPHMRFSIGVGYTLRP